MLKTLEVKDTSPLMELFGNLGLRSENEKGTSPEPPSEMRSAEHQEQNMSPIAMIDVYSLPEDTCS